jgi:hypothetical protein
MRKDPLLDSIFIGWTPLPTCHHAFQDPNDADPKTPSDPLATILAASTVASPESPQDQDASHAKCDEAGFLKLFLAKASAPSLQVSILSPSFTLNRLEYQL